MSMLSRLKLLLNMEFVAGNRAERCAQDGGIHPVGVYIGGCWDGDMVVIETMFIVKV